MNTGYKKLLQGKQRKQQMTWQPVWCVCLSSKLWNHLQPRCVKLQLSSSEAQGTCHYQIIVCSDSRNYTSNCPWKLTCCQNTNHCYPIHLNAKFDCSTEGLHRDDSVFLWLPLDSSGNKNLFFSLFQKHTSVCSSELLSIGFCSYSALPQYFHLLWCCQEAVKALRQRNKPRCTQMHHFSIPLGLANIAY